MFKKILIILLVVFVTGCIKAVDNKFSLDEAQYSYEHKDYERTFKIAESLAYEGDAQAQYTLGYLYYNGLGVEQNKQLGLAWIRRSASQEYEKANVALSLFPN